MRMLNKNDLNSDEMDTLRISRTPTTVGEDNYLNHGQLRTLVVPRSSSSSSSIGFYIEAKGSVKIFR